MAGTTSAQGGGDGAAAQAQQKAQDVAGQAKEQATQVAGQAKSTASTQVRTQVDQRSTQAGEQITSQASDIRTVAESLREQGKDKPAQLAEQAASRIEGVGNYLTQSDADRILHDVEDFARQKPTAVIGGGMVLGFLASRFLKASSSERYSARSQQLPNTATRPQYSTPAPVGAGNELSGGVTPGTTPTGTGYRSPADDRLGGPAGAGIPPTPPTTGGL